MRISAYEEAGRLHIKVKDDGEVAGRRPRRRRGTGVGLRNVCDRLIARYGARAGCMHGADPDGGYTVHLYMPVVQQWLSAAPLRVMVVDDEPLAVERLQLLLARLADVDRGRHRQ